MYFYRCYYGWSHGEKFSKGDTSTLLTKWLLKTIMYNTFEDVFYVDLELNIFVTLL